MSADLDHALTVLACTLSLYVFFTLARTVFMTGLGIYQYMRMRDEVREKLAKWEAEFRRDRSE
jgi:hypothetical protein